MKALGATTEKAALLFPGVIIKEWTPPETEEEQKSFVSYVSSVGVGQFKIELSEAIMLPLSYKQHHNMTRRLYEINDYGLDNSAVSVQAISNQEDKSIYEGLTYTFTNISDNELTFEIIYPERTKVSKGSQEDILIITIEKPEMFVGKESHQLIFN